MMQRLLCGRWLYLVLGLVTVFLYARAIPPKLSAPHTTPSAAQTEESLEWWPKTLDRAALARLAAQQPPMAMTLTVLSMFAVGMSAGGLMLGLWALWTGRIRAVWRFPSRRIPSWSFGELGRILALTLVIASLLPFVRLAIAFYRLDVSPDTHLWIPLSMLVLDGFVILAILAFASGKRQHAWKSLGLSSRNLSTALAVGFRGYLAVFPWIFLLLFLVVHVTRSLGLKPPIEPIQELLFRERRPGVLGLTVLLACVIGPIAEELFFRGVVYAAIRQRMSRTAAMLISGATFAFVHANPVGFLPIMALGCLLANLYERTGSLASPLAVHILHNSFLMSLALLVRQLLFLS